MQIRPSRLRFRAAPRVGVPARTVNHRKTAAETTSEALPLMRVSAQIITADLCRRACRISSVIHVNKTLKTKCHRTPGFAYTCVRKHMHVRACECPSKVLKVQPRRCVGRQVSIPAVRGGLGAEVEVFAVGTGAM